MTGDAFVVYPQCCIIVLAMTVPIRIAALTIRVITAFSVQVTNTNSCAIAPDR